MAYDNRFRTRVIKYILEGHTQSKASKVFDVWTTSIKRWIAACDATGTAGGGYAVANRSPRKISSEELNLYMKKHPDAFLKEIAEEFSCCNEGARKALARNRITLKKRRNTTKSAMRRQGEAGRKE